MHTIPLTDMDGIKIAELSVGPREFGITLTNDGIGAAARGDLELHPNTPTVLRDALAQAMRDRDEDPDPCLNRLTGSPQFPGPVTLSTIGGDVIAIFSGHAADCATLLILSAHAFARVGAGPIELYHREVAALVSWAADVCHAQAALKAAPAAR